MRLKVTYVSHMGHIYYSKWSIPNIFSNTLASEKCAFVALLVLRQVVNPSSLSLMHVCNSKTIEAFHSFQMGKLSLASSAPSDSSRSGEGDHNRIDS